MAWELTGNAGTNPNNDFLGTSDNQPLTIKTNGKAALHIASNGNVGIGAANPQRPLQIGRDAGAIDADVAGIGFSPSDASPHAGYIRFGDNTGWKLHIGRSRERSSGTLNAGPTGVLMTIQDNGNVGIGTTNPRAKLDVSGSGGVFQCCAPVPPTLSLAEDSRSDGRQSWLQFHNAHEAEAYIRLAGGGPAGSGREGQRRLEIGDNQGETTGLTVTGNVGIGTTTPRAKLDVAGTLNVSGETSIQTNGVERMRVDADGTTTIHGGLRVTNVFETWRGTLVVHSTDDVNEGGEIRLLGAGSYPEVMLDNHAGTLRMITGGQHVIWVQPNGNVGIGTTTPRAKLDVSGSGGVFQCCAPVLPTLSLAEDSRSGGRQSWLQFHNAHEAEAYIRLAGGGPAGSGREGQRRLEIGDNQGETTGLTVTGNVGIGTTNPGVKLEVAGNIRANDVILTSDARLKTKVRPLTDTLAKLQQIRGVVYTLRDPNEPSSQPTEGSKIGVLAQEVEAVFPELVDSRGNAGYKGVNYSGLIGVLVEASKELLEQNKRLMEQDEALSGRIEALEQIAASH